MNTDSTLRANTFRFVSPILTVVYLQIILPIPSFGPGVVQHDSCILFWLNVGFFWFLEGQVAKVLSNYSADRVKMK